MLTRSNARLGVLGEFEGRAYDCELTDPQQVDVLVRYVDPRTASSVDCSMDVIYVIGCFFGNPSSTSSEVSCTTPRHLVTRQKLRDYVKTPREGEWIAPVGSGTRRRIMVRIPPQRLRHPPARLIARNSFQPRNVPFHIEDIYDCVHGVFVYDSFLLSRLFKLSSSTSPRV
jgi:hypothetical protein